MHTIHHIEVVMRMQFFRITNALSIGILLILALPIVRAQPRTQVMFPTDGQVGVAADASILIRATHPIAPPSITHAWPNEEASGWRPKTPTILLVDQLRARTMPRDRWPRIALAGTYAFDDAKTLRFTPRVQLRLGVTYQCVVEGIELVANGRRVLAPALSFSFTSARPVPTIRSTTFDSTNVLQCNQSMYISMAHADASHLRAAAARVRVHSEGSSVMPAVRPIVHETLGLIELQPLPSWPVQQAMIVELPWGEVTGDEHNSKKWGAVARGAGQLNISAKAVDGRAVPEDIVAFYQRQSQVLVQGVRAHLATPLWFDGRWQFLRWESSEVPTVQSNTSASIDVLLDCDDLRAKQHITAVLRRVDTMLVTIYAPEAERVVVHDDKNNVVYDTRDTVTVSITDSSPWFSLTGIARTGSMCTGWQFQAQLGASAVYGGSTTIVSAASFANAGPIMSNAVQGYMRPTFSNRPFSLTERYGLQAFIVDEDPEVGFQPSDGVVFTTPTTFVEATQVERTPCVKAERCWEIVSVNDAAEGTGNRPLRAGSNEACETALLTDPDNTVTFSVRRRWIQLRVERVLLASEDPDDIITGRRLHPESYTIVERQVGLPDAPVWRMLSPTFCSSPNEADFHNYQVRCGDVIRLRTRGSAIRGETWKFWADKQGYAIPGGREVVGDEVHYTLVVDTDIAPFAAKDCAGTALNRPEIRIRGCFKQEFGIDALALRVRLLGSDGSKVSSYFHEVWVDPLIYYDRVDNEPLDGRQLEYIPLFGTPVRVKFTSPVDIRTVYDGGMRANSFGNLNVNATLATNLDFSVASFDHEHISFAPLNGAPVDIVEFRVCDPTTSPRKQALHFGNITLSCGTDLTSLSGEPLQTRFSFMLHSMERPGFGLFLERAKWSHDGDNDVWPFTNNAELYNVLYGAVLTPEEAKYSDLGFQRLPDCSEQQGVVPNECVYSYSDDNDYFGFGTRTLLFEPSWLGDRDYVFSHIASYDEDCKDEDDCLVNKVYALLDAVRQKTTSYQPSDESKQEGISWETAIPDIIDLGAQFIQSLLPIDDQDEFIGQMTLLLSGSEFWGAAESTAPFVLRQHDNGEYVYKARLYPRRQLRF